MDEERIDAGRAEFELIIAEEFHGSDLVHTLTDRAGADFEQWFERDTTRLAQGNIGVHGHGTALQNTAHY